MNKSKNRDCPEILKLLSLSLSLSLSLCILTATVFIKAKDDGGGAAIGLLSITLWKTMLSVKLKSKEINLPPNLPCHCLPLLALHSDKQ